MQAKSLSASQLQRKTEELQAREAYLDKREALASQPDLELVFKHAELKQLDNLIAARKTIMDSHKVAIEGHERHIKQLEATYQATVDEYKTRLSEHDGKLNKVMAQLKTTCSQLKAAQDNASERQQYLKKVEADIATATEEGNRELHGINYEITNAKHVIKELKEEIRLSRDDKKVVDNDIAGIQNAYAEEEKQVQDRIARLNEQQSEVEQAIENKNEELAVAKQLLADTSATVDAKLIILDTKEKTVIAKRQALQDEEFDMNEKRRRYTSTKSLYDLE